MELCCILLLWYNSKFNMCGMTGPYYSTSHPLIHTYYYIIYYYNVYSMFVFFCSWRMTCISPTLPCKFLHRLQRCLVHFKTSSSHVDLQYLLCSLLFPLWLQLIHQSVVRIHRHFLFRNGLQHFSLLIRILAQSCERKAVQERRAKEYYEQAAHLGHAQAQLNLGVLYHNGQGVAKDFVKARQLWNKAAATRLQQGEEDAIKYLKIFDDREENKKTTETKWWKKNINK